MIKNLLALCMLASFFNAYATQFIPMDPLSVIQVKLSSRHHNRLGINGDRIKKAFFKNSEVSIEVEEGNGQIFVQALRALCPPTTISLVTASGKVQDLELHFEDSSSEIIMLQPISEAIVENCMVMDSIQSPLSSSVDQDIIKELVEGYVRGILPEGYVSVDDPDVQVKDQLKFQRLNRLVNNQQIIFVYRLQNISKCAKRMTECQVNVLDGDWVFLDRYKLKPDECALVLIGCMR